MKAFFDIRPATRDDMKISPYQMRIGQLFFLVSKLTGKPEGVYQITEDTDPYDIKNWLENNMIYVPVTPLDNNVTIEE
ncbi:hypothetical protein [Leptobacterium sp. I13]|uniref:hypothetical protein n=1 Tax=Leptobacterium meishanense TaxID=3128904 RepID=UPI0030ED3B2C